MLAASVVLTSAIAAALLRLSKLAAQQSRFRVALKLYAGLELRVSTLFEGFELGESIPQAELHDLLSYRSPAELRLAARMLRALFEELDQRGT